MTLREDAIAARAAADRTEAALVVQPPAPWAGNPIFERDRAEALEAIRRIWRAATEIITETGGGG